MKLNIKDAEFHRNGVGGAGAFIVKFQWKEGRVQRDMMAVFYPEEEDKEYTQVFIPDDIGMCWRSADVFWPELKKRQGEIEHLAFPGIPK